MNTKYPISVHSGLGFSHDSLVNGQPARTCEITPKTIATFLFEEKYQTKSVITIRKVVTHSSFDHLIFLFCFNKKQIKIEPKIDGISIKIDLPSFWAVGMNSTMSKIIHKNQVQKLCPAPLFFLTPSVINI